MTKADERRYRSFLSPAACAMYDDLRRQLTQAKAEIERLRNSPPTQWAYDRVCEARTKWHEEAKRLRGIAERLRSAANKMVLAFPDRPKEEGKGREVTIPERVLEELRKAAEAAEEKG